MVTQFPTENPPLATVNTHLLRLCRDLQCHRDPSLTCPKPTGRTEGIPACKPSNGSAVPGCPSVQAALLSPEIGESWLSRRLSVPGRRKRTRPAVVAGRYHRGQRTGHVRTGVTRNLGEPAVSLLMKAGRQGVPAEQEPWRPSLFMRMPHACAGHEHNRGNNPGWFPVFPELIISPSQLPQRQRNRRNKGVGSWCNV